MPLTLAVTVQELSAGGCAPLAGAHVDIWHCDAGGTYSDEAANNTVGHKFLRGYQISDDAGQRLRNGAQSPYNSRGRTRDTRNSNDMVLQGMSNSSSMFVNLVQTAQRYAATAIIGTISPGSWVAIFGQNLAAATHTLGTADLVDGNLPASLAGVSVSIAGQPAFVYYVSPGQLVVQAPAVDTSGAVPVVVTNSGGASDPVNANLQPVAPTFFTSNGYAAAVASGTPGILQIYGTGFGPTVPAVSPGTVSNGSAPTVNSVSATIGGVAANVLYAGLAGAGLYQLNVAVPIGASGNLEVVARWQESGRHPRC